MSQDTPGTRPDPEMIGDGDTNQLPQEDTLVNRGLDDALDEGYSPPERPSRSLSETPHEQNEPDSLEERENQTNPEVWESTANDPDRPGSKADPDRVGRLVTPEDPGTHHEQDVAADELGISGGAATAEEAAMHYEEGEGFYEEMLDANALADEILEGDRILEGDEIDEDESDGLDEFER